VNNIEGKIITGQDLRESKQFHDEQAANSNYNLRQDLNILSDTLSDRIAKLDIRVARLNVKLDSLIENYTTYLHLEIMERHCNLMGK
jgi:uncharacterized small protein (DUF1192 family)